MCRGSIEAVGLPPHARASQILWLTHCRRWHRDLVGLLDGAGSRVRSGARVSICKAYERREVHANLLVRAACLSCPATLEIDRTAQHRRRQRAAGRNGRATQAGFPTGTPSRSGAERPTLHTTMRSKASRTARSVSFSVASSMLKSGMSEARASRSLSARGASSATNGLSRHSLSTWVSVW